MKRIVSALTLISLMGFCTAASAQQPYSMRNQSLQQQSAQPFQSPQLQSAQHPPFLTQEPQQRPTQQQQFQTPQEIELQQYEVHQPHVLPQAPAQDWYICPDPLAANGKSPFSASISLNQDVFFGTYFDLVGMYAINDVTDFTFYSILWNTPSFSFTGGGQGLWTEVGAGFNFNLFEGDVTINPQFGFLNGTLLSGSARPLVFEGVVPNITANLNTTFTEGEFYMGYYIATRSPRANDFLHWWINYGVKPWGDCETWERIISVGVHFEQLRLTRSQAVNATDIYLWLGPYVQFALPNNVALWFGGGWDISQSGNPDFYKASISFAF